MNDTLEHFLNIHPINKHLESTLADIPRKAGIYAFWWINDADNEELKKANRIITLKGSAGQEVRVEYMHEWYENLTAPCLYVGKSTNLRQRISQHLLISKTGRLHDFHDGFLKAKPYNTSCQLRWGIEHIFPENQKPTEIIRKHIGVSFRVMDDVSNAVAERFFEEDKYIGLWRPWFNIDSER